jgi:hypothetical protein
MCIKQSCDADITEEMDAAQIMLLDRQSRVAALN